MARRKLVTKNSGSDSKKATYSEKATHSRCVGLKSNSKVTQMVDKTDNINPKRKTCIVKTAVNAS